MLGGIVKKINANTPYSIKLLMSRFIRKRLIGNKDFLETYKFLENSEKMNDQQINAYQQSEIRKLLMYVNSYSSFYHKTITDNNLNLDSVDILKELKKLPILTKSDIVKHYDELLTNLPINVYTARTGGTTGKPLIVTQDMKSIYQEKAYIYHNWKSLGYDYNTSKIITFRAVDVGDKIFKYNPLYNEIILSPSYLNNKRVVEYINIINKFQPDFIHGYPTAIKNFCRIIEEENIFLKKNLKGVFFISEEIGENDRAYIEKVLKCNSSIFYGHTERCVFGEEISKGKYECNPFYGYTELIPTEFENEYRIIGTGFLNKKMPFIRYDTGDIALKVGSQIFIKGRAEDHVLYGFNQECISIGSKVFYEKIFGQFTKYQFIQDEIGHVIIKILDKNFEEKSQELSDYLSFKFGGVLKFELQKVENLELTERGKEKLVIQNVKM